MMVKIEEGKRYKTKDGHVVGPMKIKHGSFWAPQNGYYAADGSYQQATCDSYDLIEEWSDTPEKPASINIVTRRKIVPNDYGIVTVYVNNSVAIHTRKYTPEELREAAHILNQIAEYLEGEK